MINIADDGPATAAGDADGYVLVVGKWRARTQHKAAKAAKEAAERAPAGRLRVQKGGRAQGRRGQPLPGGPGEGRGRVPRLRSVRRAG
eukprot:7074307-Prymnesium_polylepis.1